MAAQVVIFSSNLHFEVWVILASDTLLPWFYLLLLQCLGICCETHKPSLWWTVAMYSTFPLMCFSEYLLAASEYDFLGWWISEVEGIKKERSRDLFFPEKNRSINPDIKQINTKRPFLIERKLKFDLANTSDALHHLEAFLSVLFVSCA